MSYVKSVPLKKLFQYTQDDDEVVLLASENEQPTDSEQLRDSMGLGTSAVTDLLDEDDMSSNSASAVPSQQSVKAYVDNNTDNAAVVAAIEEDPRLARYSLEIGNPLMFGDLSKLAAKIKADSTYKARVLVIGDSIVKDHKLGHFIEQRGDAREVWGGSVVFSGVTLAQFSEYPNGVVYYMTSAAPSATIGDSGINPVYANTLKVIYKAISGAGTFSVEYAETTSGPWTTLAASVNADNGGAAAPVIATYTLPAEGDYVARVTRISGEVTFLAAAMIDARAKGAIMDLSRGGTDLDQWYATPEAIIAPIVDAFDPDVIYCEHADLDSKVDTYQEVFIDRLTASMSSKPGVILATRNPYHDDTNDVKQISQSASLYAIATARRWGFIDWRNYFGDGVTAYNLGLVGTAGTSDVHPTADLGYPLQLEILANTWPDVFSTAWDKLQYDLTAGGFWQMFVKGSTTSKLLSPVTEANETLSFRPGFPHATVGSYGIGFRRRTAADTKAAEGIDLNYFSNTGTTTTYWLISKEGSLKIGSINTGTTETAATDGFQVVFGSPSTSRSPLHLVAQDSGNVDVFRTTKGTGECFTVNFAGQAHARGGYYQKGDGSGAAWLAGDVAPTPQAATLTTASPTVVTLSGHGFATGTAIKLATDGSLTGITAGTTYYVEVIDTNTFYLRSSNWGRQNLSAQSGSHTVEVSAINGSLYSMSGGTGGLYVRESGAWVLK